MRRTPCVKPLNAISTPKNSTSLARKTQMPMLTPSRWIARSGHGSCRAPETSLMTAKGTRRCGGTPGHEIRQQRSDSRNPSIALLSTVAYGKP
jgi:hypothetical protein